MRDDGGEGTLRDDGGEGTLRDDGGKGPCGMTEGRDAQGGRFWKMVSQEPDTKPKIFMFSAWCGLTEEREK